MIFDFLRFAFPYYIVVAFVVAVLCACGVIKPEIASKPKPPEYSIHCVNGVEYVITNKGGITPQVSINGDIVECGK